MVSTAIAAAAAETEGVVLLSTKEIPASPVRSKLLRKHCGSPHRS